MSETTGVVNAIREIIQTGPKEFKASDVLKELSELNIEATLESTKANMNYIRHNDKEVWFKVHLRGSPKRGETVYRRFSKPEKRALKNQAKKAKKKADKQKIQKVPNEQNYGSKEEKLETLGLSIFTLMKDMERTIVNLKKKLATRTHTAKQYSDLEEKAIKYERQFRESRAEASRQLAEKQSKIGELEKQIKYLKNTRVSVAGKTFKLEDVDKMADLLNH